MTNQPSKADAPPRQIHIDGGSMNAEERLAFTRVFHRERYDVSPLGTDPPRLEGSAHVWMLEPMMVARSLNQYVSSKRIPGPSVGRTVRFRLVTGGSMQGVIDGESFSLEPGQVSFDANEVDVAFELKDYSDISFAVSATSLGYDAETHARWHFYSDDDPVSVLFKDAANSFLKQLGNLTAFEADRMGLAMLGLLRGMVEGLRLPEMRDARSPRLPDFRAFLEKNLTDPDLSVDTLLEVFPTSRSVIYRQFSEEGGVARYITSRRMARALHLLLARGERVKIADIAKAVGMPNQRYFSSQFRKHFGMPPREARRAFLAPMPELAADEKDKPIKLGERKRAELYKSERGKSQTS